MSLYHGILWIPMITKRNIPLLSGGVTPWNTMLVFSTVNWFMVANFTSQNPQWHTPWPSDGATPGLPFYYMLCLCGGWLMCAWCKQPTPLVTYTTLGTDWSYTLQQYIIMATSIFYHRSSLHLVFIHHTSNSYTIHIVFLKLPRIMCGMYLCMVCNKSYVMKGLLQNVINNM